MSDERERIGIAGFPMTVSEALCIAEQMVLGAQAGAKKLFGRDLALAILWQRVKELSR
jgi:hypothetical protein